MSIPTSATTPPNPISMPTNRLGSADRPGRTAARGRRPRRDGGDQNRRQRRGEALLAEGDQREGDRDLRHGEQHEPAERQAPQRSRPPGDRHQHERRERDPRPADEARREAVVDGDLDEQVGMPQITDMAANRPQPRVLMPPVWSRSAVRVCAPRRGSRAAALGRLGRLEVGGEVARRSEMPKACGARPEVAEPPRPGRAAQASSVTRRASRLRK